MKTIFILLLWVAAFPAWALENTLTNREAQAERYLQLAPPREMLQDMVEQMGKKYPADQRKEFKAVMKYLDVDAISKAMKDSLVKDFTADELKALADFYASPAGKSVMKKFAHYTSDVLPVIQREIAMAQSKAAQAKQKP